MRRDGPQREAWRTPPTWYAVLLAILSAGAAGVHGSVAGEHLREAAIFGLFFAVVAGLQLAWAGWVLVRPSRRVLILAALGNALVMLTWAISRTVGVPLGPEPGVREAAGFVDVATTGLEGALVIGCAVALAPRAAGVLQAGAARRIGVCLSVAAAGVAITALAAAGRPEGSETAAAANVHVIHLLAILVVAGIAALGNAVVGRPRGSSPRIGAWHRQFTIGRRRPMSVDDALRDPRARRLCRGKRIAYTGRRPGTPRVAPSAGWPSG